MEVSIEKPKRFCVDCRHFVSMEYARGVYVHELGYFDWCRMHEKKVKAMYGHYCRDHKVVNSK